MKFRWTIKELEEFSDFKILRGLVAERLSTLNPYNPLSIRLNKIYAKLYAKLDENIREECGSD